MSGVRLYNRRQCETSEYLADHILSALGLVTQVPRQEDIGFDLVCNLAEQRAHVSAESRISEVSEGAEFPASMGPRSRERGEASGWQTRTRSPGLQWGRAHVSAERLPRRRPRV